MGKDEMNKAAMNAYLGSRKMDGNQGAVVYSFLLGIFKIFQIKKKLKKHVSIFLKNGKLP